MIGKIILMMIIVSAIVVFVRPDLAGLVVEAVFDFATVISTVCLAVFGLIIIAGLIIVLAILGWFI
jgi:uncharacterized membrane protein